MIARHIARFSSSVALRHCLISSMLRAHPAHSPECASILQVPIQGEATP